MPPFVRIVPRLLLLYRKLLGVIASSEPALAGCFMIDCWQRWGKATSGDTVLTHGSRRDRLYVELSDKGTVARYAKT